MNVKEVKGIDLGAVEVMESEDFAVCTEKDIEVRYQCTDCDTLHRDKDDAEECCKQEDETK